MTSITQRLIIDPFSPVEASISSSARARAVAVSAWTLSAFLIPSAGAIAPYRVRTIRSRQVAKAKNTSA